FKECVTFFRHPGIPLAGLARRTCPANAGCRMPGSGKHRLLSLAAALHSSFQYIQHFCTFVNDNYFFVLLLFIRFLLTSLYARNNLPLPTLFSNHLIGKSRQNTNNVMKGSKQIMSVFFLALKLHYIKLKQHCPHLDRRCSAKESAQGMPLAPSAEKCSHVWRLEIVPSDQSDEGGLQP
ncbi:hypothetical protein JW933_09525, partial [candidate division FCPU426 bacterium]|nr:hypothetical protein [candidate division FCPU426 bacterium]